MTDLSALAAIGERGVLAMMCDSTNVEHPGYTLSEKRVGETFRDQIASASGRVFIAMFSSNINRVQQVAECALQFGRKVCFVAAA